jgi:GNAT superfamily N-acetyltransferase
MITRQAEREDLKELKELWKLCFGDDDRYIDFYYRNRDWVKETAVLVQDGRIASMLTMIPVDLLDKYGKVRRASMLFAIATHPDFRKRGYAEQLIEYSNEYLKSFQVFRPCWYRRGRLFRY